MWSFRRSPTVLPTLKPNSAHSNISDCNDGSRHCDPYVTCSVSPQRQIVWGLSDRYKRIWQSNVYSYPLSWLLLSLFWHLISTCEDGICDSISQELRHVFPRLSFYTLQSVETGIAMPMKRAPHALLTVVIAVCWFNFYKKSIFSHYNRYCMSTDLRSRYLS